ncbi:MAG: sensor histidine kinase [Rudaea sp.]|nr:sensor histidine kinase [Rudaea sp.]
MAIDRQDGAQLQQRLDILLQQQRDLIAGLERGQSYFQQLARSVWRVQEEERRRLARELHDGIGQNLTAIVRMLGDALSEFQSAGGAGRGRLEKACDLAESTLAETRALSRQLRPQILDDLGLPAALRWLARTFSDSHALEVHLDLIEPPVSLQGDAAILVFRVVQEAMANIAKHAQAHKVDIYLRYTGQRVILKIRDDGCGCDPAEALATGSQGQGSGLGGVRDRVRLFGGECHIDSIPGGGFAVAIEFPFATAPAKRSS